MLKLMSEETHAHLLAFPTRKKLAFLMLLYERMIPELRSFCLSEGRDFSIFQNAHDEFWRYLADGESPISWAQLTQDILDATPSTVDFGTLEGSFALNASLLAAETAAFIADGKDEHIVHATRYAFDSLDFKVRVPVEEKGVYGYGVAHLGDYVRAHPLLTRERQLEDE